MKVFWAWQSDTPGKTGRFLVRDALQEAITELKDVPDIEEPTAKARREDLELDHDRKGVPGSPDLVRTILNKIDAATVVVADVTAVGATPDRTDNDGKVVVGKKLINSNVAIELGYALRAVTDEKVLMVFNSHYGSHEDLPFDLRHKGGALVFDLPLSADRKRIDQEKKRLKGQFVAALRPYLQKSATAGASFTETPATYSGATYFDSGEILATAGEPGVDEVDFAYLSASLCYLRLMPTSLPSPLPLARLRSVAHLAPVLKRTGNALTSINQYGAIAYEPGRMPLGANGQIKASTQLFPTGEVWAINGELISRDERQPAGPKLQPLVFERAYYDALRAILNFVMRSLELPPPWQIECGIVGIKGLNILMPEAPGG